MIFNKSYLTSFSKNKPYLALASRGKILDSKFTFTSELSLYDYSLDKHYPPLQTDSEYCKLVWCEKDGVQILATGHTNGSISLYEPDTNTSFKLIKTFTGLTGRVLGIDYNPSKNVIAAGSDSGNIIFWNLDKIDQQYKCDIPISENITSLAWNEKFSKILCVGTECGKILVLDIRLKRIAVTLQYPDIKNIQNIRWHGKSSTTLFASTNLPTLTCFKLDSNSRVQISPSSGTGSDPLQFSTVNKDTLVRFTTSKIEYLDIDTLTVRETINLENVLDASFSQRDPIYCCSYSTGTTEIFTTSITSISLANPHVQLNTYLISNTDILKMRNRDFTIQENENLESRLIKLLYEKTYNLDIETRKNVGKLLLDEDNVFKPALEEDGLIFDLEDKLIKKLIMNEKDIEDIEGRSIDLKFVLDLLYNKDNIVLNDPLHFLIYLNVRRDYENLWKIISSRQWPVMVAILLYSDLNDDLVYIKIKEIQEKLQIPVLSLLINEPDKFYKKNDETPDLPKSMFEVKDFFSKYGGEISTLKRANLEYNSPLLNEYFWFSKDRGMYNDLKSIHFDDPVIMNFNKEVSNLSIGTKLNPSTNKPVTMNNNPVTVNNKPVTINNKPVTINNKPVTMNNNPMTTNNTPTISTPSTMNNTPTINNNRPPLYSGGANRSMTSFNTKPSPKESVSSFSNKPAPPKKSLYSGVLNRSATSFSTRPDSSVSTYGQQQASAMSATDSSIPSPGVSSASVSSPATKVIPTPGTKVIPTPGTKVIPTPGTNAVPTPATKAIPTPGFKSSPPSRNSVLVEPTQQSNYDLVEISKSLEELFETLKEKAGKKNNLIVGNKIKDAVRRFTVFRQANKTDLSPLLLEKINEILEILKTENEGSVIKQKVRLIVDECIELRSCQSDIWMPAIAILVQLAY